jgi:hypothetical protein
LRSYDRLFFISYCPPAPFAPAGTLSLSISIKPIPTHAVSTTSLPAFTTATSFSVTRLTKLSPTNQRAGGLSGMNTLPPPTVSLILAPKFSFLLPTRPRSLLLQSASTSTASYQRHLGYPSHLGFQRHLGYKRHPSGLSTPSVWAIICHLSGLSLPPLRFQPPYYHPM